VITNIPANSDEHPRFYIYIHSKPLCVAACLLHNNDFHPT